ncbi:MAG: hypothetical protein EBT97_12305 [Actinobacteria bacterium]|nr:hypothetical protein [Actinomycetota bacterium]
MSKYLSASISRIASATLSVTTVSRRMLGPFRSSEVLPVTPSPRTWLSDQPRAPHFFRSSINLCSTTASETIVTSLRSVVSMGPPR